MLEIIPVCVVGYYIATAIYYATLHPLADIPGPRVCAFSRIPYWVVSIRGEDVPWMKKLHDQYGPVVRFGPTDLSYSTAQAWQDIHGPKAQEKAQEFSVQPVNGVRSMLTADYEEHARVRRLFSPAFSDRALKRQEHIFRRYADLLVDKMSEIGEAGKKPVDMMRLFNFATFDVMGELCFGEDLGLLNKNEFSPWVKSIFESLKMLPFAAMINYYPILNAVFTRFEPKAVTAQRIEHCKHSEERVDKRLEQGSDQPDIWNLVMEDQEKGKGLTHKEMHSNAEIFMLAGSETTATLLSGITYHLLKDPRASKLLTEEIRGSFARQDDITLDRLASLPYLNACLKEALRVYPPVPIGSPRVVPPGGQTVLGKRLPSGTRASVHQYSTFHSEANFTDADSFIPERWLGADSRYAGDVFSAHQPFGFGPRNCLGQNMAMHEMRLLLATVLLRFDLELCGGSQDWIDQKSYALWIKGPLNVRVRLVASCV